MTPLLTQSGYEQTKAKLAQLQQRLAKLDGRTDLRAQHLAEIRQSYLRMIGQYKREIKLFEAAQGDEGTKARSSADGS